jgi:hypothetical protein
VICGTDGMIVGMRVVLDIGCFKDPINSILMIILMILPRTLILLGRLYLYTTMMIHSTQNGLSEHGGLTHSMQILTPE